MLKVSRDGVCNDAFQHFTRVGNRIYYGYEFSIPSYVEREQLRVNASLLTKDSNTAKMVLLVSSSRLYKVGKKFDQC